MLPLLSSYLVPLLCVGTGIGRQLFTRISAESDRGSCGGNVTFLLSMMTLTLANTFKILLCLEKMYMLQYAYVRWYVYHFAHSQEIFLHFCYEVEPTTY